MAHETCPALRTLAGSRKGSKPKTVGKVGIQPRGRCRSCRSLSRSPATCVSGLRLSGSPDTFLTRVQNGRGQSVGMAM
jgi:hypothetical protein